MVKRSKSEKDSGRRSMAARVALARLAWWASASASEAFMTRTGFCRRPGNGMKEKRK